MFVPSTDPKMLVLKLENGYNIGIEKEKIVAVKVLEVYKEPVLERGVVQDQGLKRVMILHTGGTIASKVSYKTGGVVARFSPEEILEMFPELERIANIETRLVRNMFSEDMRFAHYNLLGREIEREVKKGVDGIIVTHGTDTLHYSSAALAFMLENLPISVVLVGAQRSSDRASSDAGLNLLCAAHFITKAGFKGVAVCMHESSGDDACLVLPSCKMRKMHTSRRDAFKVVNGLPLAQVWKSGEVEKLSDFPETAGKFKVSLFKEKVRVGVLKAHPNMNVEEAKAYEKFDGLVLEGTGLGHLPVNGIDEFTKEHSLILKEIEKLSKKMPVVMASQCVFGRVNMGVYESGRKLLAAGVLGNLLDMTPETAFIKLAWLLSNYKGKDVRVLVGKNLRGEISERSEFVDEFV